MSSLKHRAQTLLKGMPTLYRTVSSAYRSLDVLRGMVTVADSADAIMMGARPIVVTYGGKPRPRWGHGRASHPLLQRRLNEGRAEYARLLRAMAAYRPKLDAIPGHARSETEYGWKNDYLSGLDAIALFATIAGQRPRRYIEVGSGNSTKLVRGAISEYSLPTVVTSIDPYPRAAIDSLCDRVIRQTLETVDFSLFDELEAGDVFFFDGSHHAFMDSDVVVFWLEVLPRLKPGVLVHIHDIFLPDDYPPDWADRYYTEQYLLAAALLAPERSFEVVFPAWFIASDPDLSRLAEEQLGPRAVGRASSFWIRQGANR